MGGGASSNQCDGDNLLPVEIGLIYLSKIWKGSGPLAPQVPTAQSAADESLYTVRFSARVSRGGLRFDAFCLCSDWLFPFPSLCDVTG